MSEQIIQVLDALCDKFGIAIDWSSQNVMPYLQLMMQKYIRWEIFSSSMYVVTGILLLFSCYLWIKLAKYGKEQYKINGTCSMWDMGVDFACIGMVVCTVVGATMILSNIFTITRCLVFPELQTIQYIKEFIG